MNKTAMSKFRKQAIAAAQENILLNATVARARKKALEAGVKPLQILAVLLPFILDYFAKGKIDFAAIAKAILDLIKS